MVGVQATQIEGKERVIRELMSEKSRWNEGDETIAAALDEIDVKEQEANELRSTHVEIRARLSAAEASGEAERRRTARLQWQLHVAVPDSATRELLEQVHTYIGVDSVSNLCGSPS